MAEVKKPVADAKKEAAKKTEPVKKEEPAKALETAKKAPEKKAPAKKPAAKKKVEVKESIVVQHNGVDVSEKDLFKNARAAYKKAGNKDEVKSITIYINADEGKYYPVVNGNPVDGIDL
ncbi:MAG: DUF6465 family protein [Lachnospiraceae bacterium]|nr:DUF6465 family protein [Lachnospiraceae bacterium]